MTYEVTLEKCGRTRTILIEDVSSEDKAKEKAEQIASLDEDGFHACSTKFIRG